MPTGYRKAALVALKLIISASLLYYVLQRSGPDKVLAAFGKAGILSFALSAGLFILIIFLTSLRWGLLLSRNLGRWTLLRLQATGAFFNIFLPGLVGGDAVKIYYLYKNAGMGSEAVASVFMDRYMGYTALMCIGSMAYPFGLKHFPETWVIWVLPALVLAFISGSLLVFGLEVGRRFPFAAKVYEYFRLYRSKRAMLARALGLGLLVHVTNVLMVYVLAVGMGLDIPFASLMVFIPIVATMAALPISISGIGIREASMVLLLATAGVGAVDATALSFLWYLATVAGGSIGVVEYMRSKDYIKEAIRESG